jgi:hypothetical protein
MTLISIFITLIADLHNQIVENTDRTLRMS